MLKVRRTEKYERMLRAFSIETPELTEIIEYRTKLFRKNPDDTRLSNHPLKRKMKGKWAFSITEGIRIVYEWRSKKVVRFLAIGGHQKVYKKN